MSVIFDENGLCTNPGSVDVYYYDKETKEYIGTSNEYINLGVSIPGSSTISSPGNPETGFAYVYSNNRWYKKEDHRGETVYEIATGKEIIIDKIGPYPDGTTTTKPEPTKEEKIKKELLSLSNSYQLDITQLNVAWLAAAVSDGVNETTKKDAVISQINERKAKYSQDRASIIAQYS